MKVITKIIKIRYKYRLEMEVGFINSTFWEGGIYML